MSVTEMHIGVRIICSVRDCEGTCTHELLMPDGRPFFEFDGEGLYICASCSTDVDDFDGMQTRPIRVTDEGEVLVP